MENGDWIAIAALVVTVLGGGVGWLTWIALNVGKIVQKLDSFRDDLKEVREDVDRQDGRLDKLERRVAPAHGM